MDIHFFLLPDFGGKKICWAPDLYKYKDKFYLFITLSAPNIKRGTSVLASDRVMGTFQPLVNKAVTPQEWTCLDGSLYVDQEGTPWLFIVVNGWKLVMGKYTFNN